MKFFAKMLVTVLALFIVTPVLYAAENDIIRDALTNKFGHSSKGVVSSVNSKDGHIQISANKGGIGDENEIIIDIAVALNRADSNIGKWKKVSITILKKIYTFTRNDFDAYRSGKINDKQFLEKIVITQS